MRKLPLKLSWCQFCVLLFLGLGPPAWAVGTCTVTNTTSSQNASSRVPDANTVIITLACTGDASTGSYPSTTIPLSGSYPSGTALNAYNLTGFFLYEVERVPGTTNPTGNYTVTVKDTTAFALDLGLLTSNGSASSPQLTAIVNGTSGYPVVLSALTVAITGNSVNSAQITLNLIFRTGVAYTNGGSAYNPAAVAITGGTIDGTTIGGTTPAAVTATTVTSKPTAANQGFTVFGAGSDSALSATLADNGSAAFVMNTGSTTFQVSVANGGNIILDSGPNSGGGAVYIAQQHASPVNIGIAGQIVTLAATPKAGGTNSVSGCSLTAAAGGAWGGKFTSGTSGTCTVVITPGITATNGFTCWSNDLTTVADVLHQTSASNATTATISGTTASGDVINWGCIAY